MSCARTWEIDALVMYKKLESMLYEIMCSDTAACMLFLYACSLTYPVRIVSKGWDWTKEMAPTMSRPWWTAQG
jgi:hypothetical protein